MRKFLFPALVAVAALIAGGLYFYSDEPISASSRALMLPVDPVPLVAETGGGEKSFTIEVADDESEREAGLMYRQSMDDQHGMLFVFEQVRPVGFWMKNTPMPLDLLFIGQDGRVRAIKHGEPYSEALISPGEPVRFVLELKAGTSKSNGIANGDRLRHPAISAASIPGSGG